MPYNIDEHNQSITLCGDRILLASVGCLRATVHEHGSYASSGLDRRCFCGLVPQAPGDASVIPRSAQSKQTEGAFSVCLSVSPFLPSPTTHSTQHILLAQKVEKHNGLWIMDPEPTLPSLNLLSTSAMLMPSHLF